MSSRSWSVLLLVPVALMVLATLGCQSPQSIRCDNGTVCGVGFVCASAGYCVLPDQLSACAGKDTGDSCSLSLGEGFCDEGTCVVAQCGNGRLDVNEACDDGNDIDDDSCSNNCASPDCGDGIQQAGEECDAGAANADDRACTSRCLAATCGDGLLRVDAEACDAGGANADDGACTLACTPNICGDGKQWQGVEACDDGNAASGDGCRDDCLKVEVCGDAEVDSGEACDDGNVNPVDGCDGCQLSTWSSEALLGAPSSNVGLRRPNGVAVDGLGNIFIADIDSQRIRRVDGQSEVITTVAGNGTSGFSGDGGPATDAELASPNGVAVDGLGNVFIADTSNQRIRRVDGQSGVITTVAGNGTIGSSGDGGAATSASLRFPRDVAVDGLGNLFIADSLNQRIRRVDSLSGIITTVAGNGSAGFSGDGGLATSAELAFPYDVVVDGLGNLFIADRSNNRIRRVDSLSGIITTVAGNGSAGFSGDGGAAISAELSYPEGVAVDGLGNLFTADSENHRIRRVDGQSGIITTVAGNGSVGFSGDGGPATSAELRYPSGVAVDGDGNLFIVDLSSNRIRRVDILSGIITTVAGNGTSGFSGDGGAATSAELRPQGVAVDGLGNLFIAGDNRIRRVDILSGIITTVAGNGSAGFSGDGGAATSAELRPRGVAVDGLGNLFIASRNNNRIRRVDGSGVITTVAGTGSAGIAGDGGAATSAELRSPACVAVDGLGNLYIAGDNRIRRVDGQSGVITTVAGAVFLSGMGLAPDARLGSPAALVLADAVSFFAGGSSGTVQQFEYSQGRLQSVIGRIKGASAATTNLARYRADDFGEVGGVAYNAADRLVYLSETTSHKIHVVSINDAGNGIFPDAPDTWTIEALAGEAGTAGYAEGIALSAEFREPQGLYFNELTRLLYVADTGNHIIRAIDIDGGTVSSVAGTAQTLGFFGDGADALDALLYNPTAMTQCPNGDLFIADTGTHHVRRVEAGTNMITTVIGVSIAASAGDGSPAHAFPVDLPRGLACDDFGNLFVTSRTAIRLLPADDSGVVDGTGPVQTIYGVPPRDAFPASVTSCLTGVAIPTDEVGARVVLATDSCTGILVELTRGP